jgi:adenylate cyclase
VPSERVERKLVAILAADVAGYSRLMGADEVGTLARLKAHRREQIDPRITAYRGRIVKTTGDGILVEFPSVVDAVQCAVEVQRGMIKRNAEVPTDSRIEFRVGINLGDVIIDGDDIYGDGVNIAARLEGMAEPGGICISRTVRDHVRDRLPFIFRDMGEQQVKNISRPLRIYALEAEALRKPAVPILPELSGDIAGALARVKPAEISIVVLPFANLSNDPEQEYFADGITEDLTTDLSRIPGALVIARNTAFTYKGKPIDVKRVGRDLDVDYVIEGSVRRAGEQVRVNIQLIDAATATHLWAERFDTDRVNLADAQNEIAGRLARTLNLQLVEVAARRIDQQGAVDPNAGDLVMRGWAFYYRSKSAETFGEAQHCFRRALKIDPCSVDARIGLALCLVHALADGLSRSVEQDEAQAEQLLHEALDRDANRPMAHVAMGLLRRYQNHLEEARAELEMAVAIDGNSADALRQLGLTLLFLGDPQAAIPQIEKAIRLNPHDPNLALYQWPLGQCYLLLGQPEQAIALLRKARAARPSEYYLHLNLAGALGLKGELEEARKALNEAIRLKPEIDSLAKYHAATPWITNSAHWALRDKTLNEGLRRAGFPEA